MRGSTGSTKKESSLIFIGDLGSSHFTPTSRNEIGPAFYCGTQGLFQNVKMGNMCFPFLRLKTNAALATGQRGGVSWRMRNRYPRAGTFSLLRICSATSEGS